MSVRYVSHFDDGIADEVLYERPGPRHAVPPINRGGLMLWPATSRCADCGRSPVDPCCMTGEDDRDERVTEQERGRCAAQGRAEDWMGL